MAELPYLLYIHVKSSILLLLSITTTVYKVDYLQTTVWREIFQWCKFL